MKTKRISIVLGAFFLFGCSQESCKIDFESNTNLYRNALTSIFDLNLEMVSDKNYFRIVRVIREDDSIVSPKVFDEIDFIEIHEDSTIIFQAPNCNQESSIHDVVNILVYAPKGAEHFKRKRNIGDYNKVLDKWYLAEHITTLAN